MRQRHGKPAFAIGSDLAVDGSPIVEGDCGFVIGRRLGGAGVNKLGDPLVIGPGCVPFGTANDVLVPLGATRKMRAGSVSEIQMFPSAPVAIPATSRLPNEALGSPNVVNESNRRGSRDSQRALIFRSLAGPPC